MGFLVSPGVQVREIDLTNVVPAVSTSIGAIAGPFAKGPVSAVTAISSEEQLLQTFGKPNSSNFEWWCHQTIDTGMDWYLHKLLIRCSHPDLESHWNL